MSPEPNAVPGDHATRAQQAGEARPPEAHPPEAHPREDWGTQTTEIARDALRAAAAAAVKRRRRRFPRLGRSD